MKHFIEICRNGERHREPCLRYDVIVHMYELPHIKQEKSRQSFNWQDPSIIESWNEKTMSPCMNCRISWAEYTTACFPPPLFQERASAHAHNNAWCSNHVPGYLKKLSQSDILIFLLIWLLRRFYFFIWKPLINLENVLDSMDAESKAQFSEQFTTRKRLLHTLIRDIKKIIWK